ncbi:MAG: sigma-70 family RNA polymerase sigma factor [Planctomycetes bacterium]|nr:sigma-70 family RNA polymerase sigma factor [Planctomycetota bacterium]
MIPILRLLRAATGSDRNLLDRYVRDRDEEAFTELVRRYGTGVWAACVRLAGSDAEDAFQAVFLTLSRKAGTVTGSLPAWLHAVTRRVASDLRRNARRRGTVEAAAARPAEAPPDDLGLRESVAVLDEELSRLPERYRAVLIVCCLEGRSRDEAAVQLGWSEAQVKGRLQRARDMLRTRLARRGVELGGALLAAAVAGPVPVRADPPSAAALTLTHGVIRAMVTQKLKLAAVLMACAGIAVAGGMALRAQPGGQNGDAREPSNAPKESRVGAAQDKKDPPPKERTDSAEKVKELQKQRIAVLKAAAEVGLKLAQRDRLEVWEAVEDRVTLLKAELEVAATEADRVTLYKKALDDLKVYEAVAKARFEAARGTELALHKVKAKRLETEIALEQEKMKQAKDGK